ncbi:MAG: neutral zinc metallopeptidase [bacterium]
MRWQNRRRSDNMEDRRGASPSRLAIGGGVGTLAVVVIALLFGADPTAILQQLQGTQVSVPSESGVIDPAQQELAEFVSVILADTEDVWRQIFESSGATYEEPRLVLFSGGVESACGMASAAMGPFYCPGDAKVYIDLSFYEDLQNRFQAPGDFAQAYVIAHEIGHHVQNQLGVMERVNAARGRVSESEFNEISVRLELQADFLAGVWAHHARKSRDFLEAGDIEEALRAASAIGDDRLQKQSQGYIVPDSFTHGTSEQRVRWFRKGLETGDVTQGDTFMANTL